MEIIDAEGIVKRTGRPVQQVRDIPDPEEEYYGRSRQENGYFYVTIRLYGILDNRYDPERSQTTVVIRRAFMVVNKDARKPLYIYGIDMANGDLVEITRRYDSEDSTVYKFRLIRHHNFVNVARTHAPGIGSLMQDYTPEEFQKYIAMDLFCVERETPVYLEYCGEKSVQIVHICGYAPERQQKYRKVYWGEFDYEVYDAFVRENPNIQKRSVLLKQIKARAKNKLYMEKIILSDDLLKMLKEPKTSSVPTGIEAVCCNADKGPLVRRPNCQKAWADQLLAQLKAEVTQLQQWEEEKEHHFWKRILGCRRSKQVEEKLQEWKKQRQLRKRGL